MKKLLLFAAILIAGFVVLSCSDDEVNQDSLTTRSYDKDAELLSKFVSINKAKGEYFINDAKKVTALSYITDQDWKELQKVSPGNRIKYEDGLKSLNYQLDALAQSGKINQIVYSTNTETWIRNIKSEAPIMVEKAIPVTTISTKAVNNLSLWVDGFSRSVNFSGNRQVRSDIRVNMGKYQYYFFEVSTTTNAVKSGSYPGEGGNNPQAVVLSGTTSMQNFSFTWTATSSEPYLEWKFSGKIHTPSSDPIANVNIDFID